MVNVVFLAIKYWYGVHTINANYKTRMHRSH